MKSKSAKIGIAIVIIIILILTAFSAVKMYKNAKYKNLLSTATTQLDSGNYKEAKILYADSLKIKENTFVIEKLKEIDNIELVEAKLQGATALINDKKPEEAMNALNSAPKTIYNALNVDVQSLKDQIIEASN